MKELTSEAQALLGRIYAEYAGQPMEAGKEEQLRPLYLSRAEQRLAISELQRAGLLTARQKLWGEKLYHIPAEALDAVSASFIPCAPAPLAAGEVRLAAEAGPGLASELFRALLFIAREGLPLTGKGSIHKKHVSRLAAQLTLREAHLQGLGALKGGAGQGLRPAGQPGYSRGLRPAEAPGLSRDGHSLGTGRPSTARAMPAVSKSGQSGHGGHAIHDYPLSVVIVLDLLLALGLVSQQADGYTLEPDLLQQWLCLPEAAMNSILYEQAEERYASREPLQQHIRLLLRRSGFQPGQWYSLAGMLEQLAAAIPAAAGEGRAASEAAALGWLSSMAGFGWAELGATADGRHAFRWAAAMPRRQGGAAAPAADGEHPLPAAGFIVQPDFEVLVPPEVPYVQRWRLAACAEWLQCDVLWSFRLTREMLEHAVAQGMPVADTLSWLQEHTHGGLPESVAFALEQWGRSIGRTTLESVRLLSCLSEEDAEIIAAHPRLTGMLNRVGPLHFIVQAEHVVMVNRELTEAGLAPQGAAHERFPANGAKLLLDNDGKTSGVYTVPNLNPGLLPLGGKLRHLTPIEPGPEADLLPNETQVPPMWSREWRTYHITTAEKVMEQGLRWGVKVRLAVQDEIVHFIPRRIQRQPWRVSGHLLRGTDSDAVEMELKAGDWREMQLILPVIARNSSSAGAAGYGMIGKSTADGRTLG